MYFQILIFLHEISEYEESSQNQLEEDNEQESDSKRVTLSQNNSENFTNISESNADNTTDVKTTELNSFNIEEGRISEFERCKKELAASSDLFSSSPSKIIKISCLSILDYATNSKRNGNMVNSTFTSGSKFNRKTASNHDSNKKNALLKIKDLAYNTNPKVLSLKKRINSRVNLLDSNDNNLVNIASNSSTKSKYCYISCKPNVSSECSNPNNINLLTENEGDENIEERPSDLYFSIKHASNRAPHAMNVLVNQGAMKLRFSDFNQNCLDEIEPDAFQCQNITVNTFNFSPKGMNSTVSNFNQSGGDFRNYNTNCTNKNKENLDPQTSCINTSSYDSSFIFGPKASNSKPKQK